MCARVITLLEHCQKGAKEQKILPANGCRVLQKGTSARVRTLAASQRRAEAQPQIMGEKNNPLFFGLEIHSLLSFRASGGEMLLF